HDPLRLRLRLDEREHALRDRLPAQWIENRMPSARLDVLRHLAQRQLAEPRKILSREEVEQRRLGAVSLVDLPPAKAILQRLGRQVDEDDLVCLVEDAVGKRLAYAHARQLEHLVVQALEM